MAKAEATATAPRPGERYVELDGLRGIAAIVVVLYHWTFRFHEIFPGYPELPVQVSQGDLGVELFFMISGFVILMTSRRHGAPRRFALARAIRLFPTFWVCMLITLGVIVAAKLEVMHKSPLEILGNLTMVPTLVGVQEVDGSYWSLNREIVFYVIIIAALALFSHRVPTRVVRGLAIGWPLFGLACALVHRFAGTDWSLVLFVGSMAQYSPLFCIGMLLYLYRADGIWSHWVFALVGMAATTQWIMTRDRASTIILALICLGFIAVVRRGDVPALRWRPLVWLGAISYPLYLLHQNIGYVVFMRTPEAWGPWLPRVLTLAFVVVTAWLVHEVVEIRFSRWATRTLLPRPPGLVKAS